LVNGYGVGIVMNHEGTKNTKEEEKKEEEF
jgi:hypothetical protein